MYIQGKYVSGSELSEVRFVREQAGVEPFFPYDSMAIHAIAHLAEDENQKQAVACGRLIFDGDQYTIDHLYSIEEGFEQYCEFVLKMLIFQAVSNGATEVFAHCPTSLQALYQKNLFVLQEASSVSEGQLLMKLSHANQSHCCQ